MRKTLLLSMLAGLVFGWLALPAAAQPTPRTCPEGRTASGQCVKADLAQDMRTGAIVYSQPKISLTNPPLLPEQDGDYVVIRDNREVRNVHGRPLINSANGEIRRLPFFTFPFFQDVAIGPRP